MEDATVSAKALGHGIHGMFWCREEVNSQPRSERQGVMRSGAGWLGGQIRTWLLFWGGGYERGLRREKLNLILTQDHSGCPVEEVAEA